MYLLDLHLIVKTLISESQVFQRAEPKTNSFVMLSFNVLVLIDWFKVKVHISKFETIFILQVCVEYVEFM